MAPRPYWKGYLKLSLVTCPVSLTPATSDREKVRFHTINSETGNRVRSRYVDAGMGKPVEDEDEVRGYEVEKDRHVVIEDEELEAVGLESTRTIDIEQFVASDSIEWIWYDTPYYLMPDDAVAQEAFAVIRKAMEVTDTLGISRLVLARRERAVMLEPCGKGIVLWTLRYGDEVRQPKEVFGDIADRKADSKLVGLVQKVIDERTESWDPSMVGDPVQANLKKLIASKRKKSGGTRKAKKMEEAAEEPRVVARRIGKASRSFPASVKRDCHEIVGRLDPVLRQVSSIMGADRFLRVQQRVGRHRDVSSGLQNMCGLHVPESGMRAMWPEPFDCAAPVERVSYAITANCREESVVERILVHVRIFGPGVHVLDEQNTRVRMPTQQHLSRIQIR